MSVLANPARSETQRGGFDRDATKVIYEQPLNERFRSLLRLEHLLHSIDARTIGTSEWDVRAAVAALIDVTDVLWRSDIKGELTKELDRVGATLQRLQANPGVDAGRLAETLLRVEGVARAIKDPGYQPGQLLRRDELANAIRQRLAIPGGTCSFDVPAYHYWLTRAPDTRLAGLSKWLEDLSLLREGIHLVLKLIRESVDTTRATALGGFFQQSLDPNASYQLIRVQVPAHLGLFPEISAGRFRFTLRFLEQPDTSARPAQTEHDVEFGLQCCLL